MTYNMLYKIVDSKNRVVGAVISRGNKRTSTIKKKDFNKYNFSNVKVTSDLKLIGDVPCKKIYELRKKKKAIVLYHGSPNEIVNPTYGLGNDSHDYGKGFYLTPDLTLAMEWAVSSGNNKDGYVHKYVLDLNGMDILDFDKENCLVWIAELMKHRDADTSARYRHKSKQFIEKFGIDISKYDVIKGWRADSSYFRIAKSFVRDEIDYKLLPELLKYGDLGIQYCLKSEKAFRSIREIKDNNFPLRVSSDYYKKYNERDTKARDKAEELINSKRNTFNKGFSYVLGGVPSGKSK